MQLIADVNPAEEMLLLKGFVENVTCIKAVGPLLEN
jgi:hypothetical protein